MTSDTPLRPPGLGATQALVPGEGTADTEPPPLITVVIPTHNRAPLLHEAIRSVLASRLINQPSQVVVVDDNSTDDTPQVAASYAVDYLRINGGSPSASRNAGLARVQTPYVAFLDDDDCWLPGNMEPQLQALSSNPEAAFAYGRAQRTEPDLTPLGAAFPEPPFPPRNALALVHRIHLQLGGILFRTDAIRTAGAFDTNLRYAEDSDLLVRLAAAHPAVGVDFVGSFFRQRPDSIPDANIHWAEYQDYRRSLKKQSALGIVLPTRARISTHRHYVGMVSYAFCNDARIQLDAGNKAAARSALVHAFRVSPPHTLRHRQFWSGLARLLRPRHAP